MNSGTEKTITVELITIWSIAFPSRSAASRASGIDSSRAITNAPPSSRSARGRAPRRAPVGAGWGALRGDGGGVAGAAPHRHEDQDRGDQENRYARCTPSQHRL